jgi:hypothetical protein
MTDAITEDLKSITSNSKSPSISQSTTLVNRRSQSQGFRPSDDPIYVLEGPQEELDRKPALDEDDELLIVSVPLKLSQYRMNPILT